MWPFHYFRRRRDAETAALMEASARRVEAKRGYYIAPQTTMGFELERPPANATSDMLFPMPRDPDFIPEGYTEEDLRKMFTGSAWDIERRIWLQGLEREGRRSR